MRSLALALLLAALLLAWLAVQSAGLDPLLSAPLSVAIGVVAACAVQEGVNWLAVALGAASALASGWLESWSAPLALAVLCAMWLAPRIWLSRTRLDGAVASVAGLAASALAAVVVTRYSGATALMHVASCVFAGATLAMATLAGRTDSPLLHALRVTAGAMQPPGDELVARAVSALDQRARPSGAGALSSAERRRVAKQILRLADRLVAARQLDGPEAARTTAGLLDGLRNAVARLHVEAAACEETGRAEAPAPQSARAAADGTHETARPATQDAGCSNEPTSHPARG